ncbi:MAG TPA: hypothetical protein PKD24_13900 [Pyrinomonadaceae bacterium]|nr:hypothetical protein [Pyrinomonadaceae bacterium]HMP65999.1 hypothetical protein [Pyrinomonadaceae bacterium]
MVPSRTWFSSNLQERAAWFQNFRDQFAALATGLGFTAADVTAVDEDNAAFQWLAANAVTVDAFSAAMTAYRRRITEGDDGDPAAELPDPPVFGLVPVVLPGIFERLVRLVERIRVAPSYSEEEGAALGIIPSQSGSVSPDDMQPNPKLKALPGGIVKVAFVRGKTQGIEVHMKLDGEENWANMGKFYNSPAEIIVPANAQNVPRAVQIRCRFVLNNSPVGQFSDIDEISTKI